MIMIVNILMISSSSSSSSISSRRRRRRRRRSSSSSSRSRRIWSSGLGSWGSWRRFPQAFLWLLNDMSNI